MAPEIFTLPHASGESGDNERIKEKELEEGEIDEDGSADEDLHLSRSLLPASDSKTSKRKRRRKATSKKINNALKKRKLNFTSSFEETMKPSLGNGTVQTNGNEPFDQSKHPVMRSNDTPYRNRYKFSSMDCSDPYNDICPKKYKFYKTFCVGIKRPSQKSLKCEQKKLSRKMIRLKNRLFKNDSLPSDLKTKLCKFYPENKNDKCSYMHLEFPCKFSNTEVRCATEGNCKFRYEEFAENLTDPKKIIRNSPHLTGDGEAEVIYTRNCHNKSTKKIPSLLEIVVPIPPQFLANGSNITVSAEQSTPSKCHTTSVDETRLCTLMPSSLKKEKISNIQQRDINRFLASSDPNHDQMQQVVSGKKEELSNEKEQPTIYNRQNDMAGCVYDCISAVSSLFSKSCTNKSQIETQHHSENIFPQNLSQKQQELFLRIQQKQRKPLDWRKRDLGEQNNNRNEEDKKQTVEEQNWYSSDEDDSSLVDVLKNLPKPQSFPSKPSISSISTPIFDTVSSSSMNKSGDKLLSSIRDRSSKIVANLTTKSTPSSKICENFYTAKKILATQSKDPRLQKSYHSTISAAISSVDISEHNTQTPVRTKSSSEGTVTYSSNLGNISAYKAAIETCAGGGTGFSNNGSCIMNFRNVHNVQQNISLQPKIKRDVDLRQNGISLTSYFSTFNDNKIHRDAIPNKDVDLKGITGLPFGPTPLHPATEINASLNSHAPIPYKLIPITILPPDYSGLRAYAQTPRDPRFHRSSSLYNGINVKGVLEYLSKIITVPSMNSQQK
jgi:hypothetical protein